MVLGRRRKGPLEISGPTTKKPKNVSGPFIVDLPESRADGLRKLDHILYCIKCGELSFG
jgi:hypothetical protein